MQTLDAGCLNSQVKQWSNKLTVIYVRPYFRLDYTVLEGDTLLTDF